MRYLGILLCVSILCGCSTATPMAELEAQALETGDWSLVEKRERQLARRKARSGAACSRGATNLCVSKSGSLVCRCVDQVSVEGMLRGRPW